MARDLTDRPSIAPNSYSAARASKFSHARVDIGFRRYRGDVNPDRISGVYGRPFFQKHNLIRSNSKSSSRLRHDVRALERSYEYLVLNIPSDVTAQQVSERIPLICKRFALDGRCCWRGNPLLVLACDRTRQQQAGILCVESSPYTAPWTLRSDDQFRAPNVH